MCLLYIKKKKLAKALTTAKRKIEMLEGKEFQSNCTLKIAKATLNITLAPS